MRQRGQSVGLFVLGRIYDMCEEEINITIQETEEICQFQATDSELKTFVSLFNNIDSVPSTGADLEVGRVD